MKNSPLHLLTVLILPVLLTAGCSKDKNHDEPYHAVTVTTVGNGSASADVETAKAGQTVTLTATAYTGHSLAGWTVVSGEAVLNDPAADRTTFVMPDDAVAVRADFVYNYALTLSTDGNGTVSATNLDPAEGETVTIRATADNGYRFWKWTVINGNVALGDVTANPVSFTMQGGPAEIRAEFKEAGIYTGQDLVDFAVQWNATVEITDEEHRAQAQQGVIGNWARPNGVVYLQADLDMSSVVGFSPIGGVNDIDYGFTGRFNGLGHTISNLTVNSSGNYNGLFGLISSGGEVRNTMLVNCHMRGNSYVGGIAGFNSGTVSGCNTMSCTIRGAWYMGGIAGHNDENSLIAGCTVTDGKVEADVYPSSYTGGIAGQNNGHITGCRVADCDITTDMYCGGITGRSYGMESACIATEVRLTADRSYAGGIAGANSGHIVGVISSPQRIRANYYGVVSGPNSGDVYSFYRVIIGTLGPVSMNSGTVTEGESFEREDVRAVFYDDPTPVDRLNAALESVPGSWRWKKGSEDSGYFPVPYLPGGDQRED